MKETNILVVDDEKEIADLLEIYLISDGFQVKKAYSAAEGLKMLEEQSIDLVLLDVMMPDMDGITMCRRIRETNNIPIIMVSAKTQELDKIVGLTNGADDYVSKPFSIMELLARVKAGLRRANLYVRRHNDFSVNEKLYDISYRGQKLGLTVKEFKLLKLLIERAGETLTRDEIFKTVWGEDFMGETRALDMHIAQIRDKIKAAGGDNVIVTVRGVGYRVD